MKRPGPVSNGPSSTRSIDWPHQLFATRVIRARFLTAIPAQIADVRKQGLARPGKSENGARERGAVLHVIPRPYLAMLTYFPLTTLRIAVMPVPSRTSSMVIGPATPGKSLSVPRHWRILSRSLSRFSRFVGVAHLL